MRRVDRWKCSFFFFPFLAMDKLRKVTTCFIMVINMSFSWKYIMCRVLCQILEDVKSYKTRILILSIFRSLWRVSSYMIQKKKKNILFFWSKKIEEESLLTLNTRLEVKLSDEFTWCFHFFFLFHLYYSSLGKTLVIIMPRVGCNAVCNVREGNSLKHTHTPSLYMLALNKLTGKPFFLIIRSSSMKISYKQFYEIVNSIKTFPYIWT